MPKHILIVDDDAHIREVIQFALAKAGMSTTQAAGGKEALERIHRQRPDLVILDIGMPDMDGLQVCRELRKTSELPILFLSARDDEIDRIIGLEIGGDDYVTKPFSPRELVARVKVILRRLGNTVAAVPVERVLCRACVRLEPDSHGAYWKDQRVALTALEFMLLKTLLTAPTRVFSRDELMSQAYAGHVIVSDRTIDSHIRRIRGKYAQVGGVSVIETLHGVGYKLGSCE